MVLYRRVYTGIERIARVPRAPGQVDGVPARLVVERERFVLDRVPPKPVRCLHLHPQTVSAGTSQLIDWFQAQPEVAADVAEPVSVFFPGTVVVGRGVDFLVDYDPIVYRIGGNDGGSVGARYRDVLDFEYDVAVCRRQKASI